MKLKRVLVVVLALLAVGGAVYVFAGPTILQVDRGSCGPSQPVNNSQFGPGFPGFGNTDACKARQASWQFGLEVVAGFGALGGLLTVIAVVDRGFKRRRRAVDPRVLPHAWR